MATSMFSTGIIFPDLSVQTSAIPAGGIVMYEGTTAPPGWAICDGTNGTPDLRNRFVVGAGNLYTVGDTGGEATVTLSAPQLPSHSHSISVSIGAAGAHFHVRSTDTVPGHSHPSNTAFTSSGPIAGGGGGGARSGNGVSINAAGGHSHTVSMGSGGTHNHTVSITVGNAGAGDAHSNLPLYYSLLFIMRL